MARVYDHSDQTVIDLCTPLSGTFKLSRVVKLGLNPIAL